MRPHRCLLFLGPSLLVTVLALLSGCGGGGGTPDAPARDPVPHATKASSWRGVRQLGAAGAATTGRAMVTGADGGVYVTGATDGTLEGNRRTGSTDACLVKYDCAGTRLYALQYGAPGAETAGQSLAAETDGGVYIAGWTTGELDGGPLTGIRDGFLSRFDAAGRRLRTRQFGAAGAETACTAVVTDADGHAYVAGWTTGSLDGRPRTGTVDCFVAMFDDGGKQRFIRQFGVPGGETRGQALGVDPAGAVYVTGWTDGGLDGHRPYGRRDCFVVKLGPGGITRFIWQFGVQGADTRGNALAVDGLGGVYVAGSTDGELEPGAPAAITSAFIARYDGSGTRLYLRQLGAPGTSTCGNAVSTEGADCAYLVGSTSAGLDHNTLSGTTDGFLARFDAAGRRLYTRQLGTRGAETRGHAVSTDAPGSVHVTGMTEGRLGDSPHHGLADVYVAKYDDGDLQ